MLLIGITGRAGSGKSTVAERLISRHGFIRVKFAAPLKGMLAAFLIARGATEATVHRMIEGDLKEVPSPLLNLRTPRHAMVTLGTEWGRNLIDPELWTDAAADMIRGVEAIDPNVKIVVDDVRFPNEVEAIRKLGGEVWTVARSVADLEPDPNAHESERLHVRDALPIINSSGLAMLHALVDVSATFGSNRDRTFAPVPRAA